MERRFAGMSIRKLLLIGGSVVLWLAMLAALVVVFGMDDQAEQQAVFGSPEGRLSYIPYI